jgi:excisionase family DNA binding protein
MAKTLYTTAEAATALGVTPGRVRQMIIDGELVAEKLGRDLIINLEDIVAAKNRKTAPGPARQEKPKEAARKKRSAKKR